MFENKNYSNVTIEYRNSINMYYFYNKYSSSLDWILTGLLSQSFTLAHTGESAQNHEK